MVQFENYGEHLTEWKKGLNPDDHPDIFIIRCAVLNKCYRFFYKKSKQSQLFAYASIQYVACTRTMRPLVVIDENAVADDFFHCVHW